MNGSSVLIFFFFQALIDLCLVGLAVYWFFYHVPRREKRLERLFESLRQLASESDRAVQEFQRALGQDQTHIQDLILKLGQREEELRDLMRDAQVMLDRREQERRPAEQPDWETHERKAQYQQVLDLAAAGRSVEDISRETGVPENEIRLLLEVRT